MDFIEKHNLEKVTVVDEFQSKIYTWDINTKKIGNSVEEIVKILVKHHRRLKLKDSYYIEGNLIIIQEQLAKEFITKELLNLVGRYKIVGTEKLKKYKIKTATPKLVTKFDHAIDFLEGEAYLEVEGESFSILDILSRYKKDSYVVLSDGTNAIINRKYIEKLERIFTKTDDNKVRVSFFDLPIVEELIEEKVFTEGEGEYRGFFKNFNSIAKKISAAKINATLREYQEYGYRWLCHIADNKLGGCLADDMGLGKTIQAIALLSRLHKEKTESSIVIMPKSLIYNWKNEFTKFSPWLNISIYYGNTRDINEALKGDVILTTYGTVRNDIQKLREIKFNTLILDESQNIKNITSQTTKAIMLLNSRSRIALSGTPVENNLGELYSLFRFLNPTMFGSIEQFNMFYGIPIQKFGDKGVVEELKKKIYPFILRRTKKEVLKDLPEKIEQTYFIEMNPGQQRLYTERRTYYYDLIRNKIQEHGMGKSQIFILQALNELRQIASCPESKSDGSIVSSKREMLIESISDAVSNGHKILVFTNYIKSIESICSDLTKLKIKHQFMTGGTKNRQELVDRFQTDESIKVFVMTLKTGGVGLNLTAADTIFIYDPWWNKTAEDQAVDRSHRMGQDRTVFSYKLIAKGTIEEKMLKLQKEKSKLFEELISTDNTSIKSLDQNDIEFILGE